MIVLSLGWGRQSFTLAAMAALGDLPAVDAALFADTTFERSATYDFMRTWSSWLSALGVEVYTVKGHSPNPLNTRGGVTLPAYVLGPNGKGKLHRQCTTEWKIRPLRRWLQEARQGEKVEMWVGISLDEFKRMKPANVQYIENRWPLIELKMTRQDCEQYLIDHGLPIPPRSACVFCPYQSNHDWGELKEANGPDWKAAVTIDRLIRKAKSPYELYLHQTLVPLERVDFPSTSIVSADVSGVRVSIVSDDAGDGFEEECMGICGV